MASYSKHPTGYVNTDDSSYSLYAFALLTDIGNALDNADTNDYATLKLSENGSNCLNVITLNGFDFSEIPSGTTISSISIKIKYRFNTSAMIVWSGIDAYHGNYNPHGTTNNIPLATDEFIATISSNLGTWTREELQSFIIDLYVEHNATTGDVFLYLYGVTVTVFDSENPIITIGTPSKTKISSVSGYDQSIVTFQSDTALQSWEARATLPGITPAHGVGLLVESGTALAANTNATVYVDDEELTNGDNEYTISIFGLSAEGRWSDG